MKRLILLLIFGLIGIQSSHASQCDVSHCGDRFDLESSACKAKTIKSCQGLAFGDKISIILNSVQDSIYIGTENSPKTRVNFSLFNKEVDITHLFSNGSNKLHIESFAISNSFGFKASIYKNGTLIKSISCYKNACPSNGAATYSESNHIYYDDWHTISFYGPSSKSVTFSYSGLPSGWSGNIYINNEFTGLLVEQRPTKSLPPGVYTVGIGLNKSSDLAYGKQSGVPKNLRQYLGKYYEKVVTISHSNQTIDFSDAVQLPTQTSLRIGIVPIAKMNHRLTKIDPGGIATTTTKQYTLTQNDIDRLKLQLESTNSHYVEPFTYGLQTWDVKVLDTYTGVVNTSDTIQYSLLPGGLLQPDREPLGDMDAWDFFTNTLNNKYNDHFDILIAYYPKDFYCGAAATDGFIHLPSICVKNNPTVSADSGSPAYQELPIEIAFHEILHAYERWHEVKLNEWKGIAGIHGSNIYGWVTKDSENFTDDKKLWEQPEWIRFYENYLRGTLVENNAMRDAAGHFHPTSPPTTGDRHVGIFNSLRNGVGSLHHSGITKSLTISNRLYTNTEISNNQANMIFSSYDQPDEKMWSIEPDSNFVRLRNIAMTNDFLRTDNASGTSLMASAIDNGWHSPRWYLESVNPYLNTYYFKNYWNSHYMTQSNSNSTSVTSNAEFSRPFASEWVIEPSCEINTNLVPNCSFEDNNASNWQLLNHNGAWGWTSWSDTDLNDNKGNSEVKINIDYGSNTPWHIQLRTELSIPSTRNYILSFKAKTEKKRKISVNIGEQGGNWGSYFNTGDIVLTSQWRNFSFRVENLPADNNAVLDFNVGKYGTEDVFIDNVILVPTN